MTVDLSKPLMPARANSYPCRVQTESGHGFLICLREPCWTSTKCIRSINVAWRRRFLEHAERHGVPGARHALVRGFNWVLGGNQLGVQMLVPELQMTIRSQVRRGEMHTKMPRMVRAMKGAVLGRKADLIDRAGLELRLECRSYELGWVLWSFGQRADLPELTQRDVFL